jgi:hypothetical protein
MGIGAAIGAGSSLLGGLFGANSANQASQAQQQANQQAIQAQLMMFNKSQENLAPFLGVGKDFANQLLTRAPELTRTFQPTQAELEATPGYQFTKNQGLQGVQNSYASKGLGISGAALKGAGEYATGLADQTYQHQLENFLKQNQQQYNMLLGGAQLGANAATGASQNAIATGQGVAGNLVGAGNAEAGGAIGVGNALTGATSGISQYALLNQLMQGSQTGANGNWLGSLFSR